MATLSFRLVGFTGLLILDDPELMKKKVSEREEILAKNRNDIGPHINGDFLTIEKNTLGKLFGLVSLYVWGGKQL